MPLATRKTLVYMAAALLLLGVAVAYGAGAQRGASSQTGEEVELSPSERMGSDDHVVLLHGLGRSERSMRLLERTLSESGYAVHNIGYPSRSATPEEIVAGLHEELEECCAWAGRLHFVTHSLGGILTRAYIAEHRPPNLGRVVMLAPPNRGSEYVDLARQLNLEKLLGPTGAQLGTDPDSLPNRLPEPGFELGVIAGTSSLHPLGNAVLPGNHDGTVSVESTRIPGTRDFLALDVSHTFIMRNESVARQVIAFLRNGRFDHDTP